MTTIALAGLGAAARDIHLPAYRLVPGLEVVAGCDPRPSAGDDLAFPVFASAEEMLAAVQPDLLAVVTPPDSHGRLARLGLEAGCHVLCEKPIAPTLAEARELALASSEAGRWLVVNQQYRFMNVHRQSRRLIGSPELGELLFVDARQTFYRSAKTEAGWRGRELERTCREFGIHVFDLCRYFFGADPLAITAHMPGGTGRRRPDLLNLIHLDFPGDRAAHITLDRLSRGRHRYLELRLDGSEGCIESRLGGAIECSFGVRGGSRRPFLEHDVSLGGRARLYRGERYRKIAADPLDLFSRATAGLLQRFLEALDEGSRPPCDAADNLRSFALVPAAYRSARTGKTVEMTYEEIALPNAAQPELGAAGGTS